MAMEDAVSLAERVAEVLRGEQELEPALSSYQDERAESVRKIQDAARPSLAWWERFGFYQRELDPLTFTFHFFSRSIGVAKIAQRDPGLVEQVRADWASRHGSLALESTLEVGGQPTSRFLRALPPDVPRVEAPADESGLSAAVAQLPDMGAVAVAGPAELCKVLLSEEARLRRHLTTFLVGDYDEDAAETLLLSGRCDAVVADPASGPAAAAAGHDEVAR
jgi:anthraniloyl-CoA monooxygenase